MAAPISNAGNQLMCYTLRHAETLPVSIKKAEEIINSVMESKGKSLNLKEIKNITEAKEERALGFYFQELYKSGRVGFDVSARILKEVLPKVNHNMFHVFLCEDQETLNQHIIVPNEYPSGIQVKTLFPDEKLFRLYIGNQAGIKDDREELAAFISKVYNGVFPPPRRRPVNPQEPKAAQPAAKKTAPPAAVQAEISQLEDRMRSIDEQILKLQQEKADTAKRLAELKTS